MSCCYTQLGTFPHNEPINTGIVAEKSGKYVYRLNFLGAIIYKEQTVEAGDDLIVPVPFNENYSYELKVIDPDRENVVNPSNDDCDTWMFTTFIAIKENCNGTNECDDVDNLNDNPYS